MYFYNHEKNLNSRRDNNRVYNIKKRLETTETREEQLYVANW